MVPSIIRRIPLLMLLAVCTAAADLPAPSWRDFCQTSPATLRSMYQSVDVYVAPQEAARLLKQSAVDGEGARELNVFCRHFKFRFDLSQMSVFFLGDKATGHMERDADNLAQILGECYLRYRVHGATEFSFWGRVIRLDQEISKTVDTKRLNTKIDNE